MKRSLLILLAFVAIFVVIPLSLLVVGVFLSELHAIKYQPREIVPEGWSVEQIAMLYAPVVLQETSAPGQSAHYDHLCAIDFDGDWNTRNNLASLEKDGERPDLKATVYYAVIETKTHFAIVYSFFHPLDWSYEDQRLWCWYENEIKNVQLLIRKTGAEQMTGQIWSVAVQRSHGVDFYKTSACQLGEKGISFKTAAIMLTDATGKPCADGTHPVLVMTSGRHQLFMPEEKPELFANRHTLKLMRGITYLPATANPEPGEKASRIAYTLVSLTQVWNPAEKQKHAHSFHYFRYEDDQIIFEQVPMMLASNELEGMKSTIPNPNILPFAMGRGLRGRCQGTFFFNPVAAYQRHFLLRDWSLQYLYHPYADGFSR